MGVTYKDMGFNLSEDEQRIYDAGYAQGKQTGMLIRGENTSLYRKEENRMKRRGSYIFDLLIVGGFAALTAIVTKRIDDKGFDEKLDEALEERGFVKKEEEAE